MSFLSWNCRGLAAATTTRELRDVCRTQRPDIVFLMETRAHKERIKRYKRMLKFQHAFSVDPRGLSGGLGLFWSQNIDLQILASSANFIHTAVLVKESKEFFECTFVYGNPIFQQRRSLWDKILAFHLNRNAPWCCLGDFNEMLSMHDKEGIRPIHQNQVDLFRKFLDIAGLIDLDLKGCKFTWHSNPRNGIVTKERIDRVLVNWAWRLNHSHAVAVALPSIGSDHSPIVLHSSPKAKSGVLFKFEAFWEEHEDCNRIIENGWHDEGRDDSPWNKLLDRTNSCKKYLQQWHHNTFKRADKEILRLKGRLKFLLNLSNEDSDWDEINSIKQQIDSLWKQEEAFWGQRSRLKWIQCGDRNSKFFHATTIQRRGRNRILRLKKEDGSWVEGQENLFEEIIEHYRVVYHAGLQQNTDFCLSHVPDLVSDEMNFQLTKPVSQEEIKRAVFGLGALKAPGPDGLNGMFYQKHWEVVKEDVCNAIQIFFQQGILPTEINETIVTLIPKIPHPEYVAQLRPISCCNFIFKVISKIMVFRLKDLMGLLITPNQSTFVGGRMIQDNLLVAHEIFHDLKGRGANSKTNVAIKLDMSKAYDRVEWSFLQKVLIAYGFNSGWVDLIMTLVSSVTYKYKVNGFLSQVLIPQKGLRQGDPLSPYLFILVADVLSHMLMRAQIQGQIQGIRWGNQGPVLTHLFFADDALLFAKAASEEIFQIVNLLN